MQETHGDGGIQMCLAQDVTPDGVNPSLVGVNKSQGIMKACICLNYHVSILIGPHACISKVDSNGRRNDVSQPCQISNDTCVDGNSTVRPSFATDLSVHF